MRSFKVYHKGVFTFFFMSDDENYKEIEYVELDAKDCAKDINKDKSEFNEILELLGNLANENQHSLFSQKTDEFLELLKDKRLLDETAKTEVPNLFITLLFNGIDPLFHANILRILKRFLESEFSFIIVENYIYNTGFCDLLIFLFAQKHPIITALCCNLFSHIVIDIKNKLEKEINFILVPEMFLDLIICQEIKKDIHECMIFYSMCSFPNNNWDSCLEFAIDIWNEKINLTSIELMIIKLQDNIDELLPYLNYNDKFLLDMIPLISINNNNFEEKNDNQISQMKKEELFHDSKKENQSLIMMRILQIILNKADHEKIDDILSYIDVEGLVGNLNYFENQLIIIETMNLLMEIMKYRNIISQIIDVPIDFKLLLDGRIRLQETTLLFLSKIFENSSDFPVEDYYPYLFCDNFIEYLLTELIDELSQKQTENAILFFEQIIKNGHFQQTFLSTFNLSEIIDELEDNDFPDSIINKMIEIQKELNSMFSSDEQ